MSRCMWLLGGWSVLLVGFLAMTLSSPRPTLGQNPPKKIREEEEEEPEKTRIPKSIDPKSPSTPSRQPLPPSKFDIAEEAGRAKNIHIRDFLQRLAIPYDLLVSSGGRSYRIGLLPMRKLPDERFSFVELDAQLNRGKEKELPTGVGFSLQPFEEIALEEVDIFLRRQIDGALPAMKKELAVQVLQAIRRFHASAIEQRKRVGRDWDPVDDKLRRRIIAMRLEQLRAAKDARDYRKADELSLELTHYADDPQVNKDIYKLVLEKELDAADPDKDEDYLKIRDALNQFENIAGGKGDPVALSARRRLSERARHLVQAAKKLSESNQNAAAFNMLRAADALDPELADIQKLRSQLRDRILYVGVPRLPNYVTPATARLDSEKWGVDLVFESLLDVIPDPDIGRHYEPVLAEALPTLAPLGRDFVLRRNIRWSGEGAAAVNAHDIFGTLDLMRKVPHLPASEGLDVFDSEKARVDDPFRLRLAYRQGVLEPLNRATFKVLPARYLKANGKGADDLDFARKPFGSGPYKYEGREKEPGGREVAVFRANPYFSQRPGNFGQPNVREIRMVVPQVSSGPANFSDGLLHIAFDVPTDELARYTGDPLAGGLIKVWTPTNNRRVWMLAFNHRRLGLQNADLRRGISAAIDRDDILNTVYRTEEMRNVHRAMTGPFPPHAWATPARAKEKGVTLTNRNLAGGLLAGATAGGPLRLNLRYADDDPRAARACAKIKEQIESQTSGTNGPALQIELKPIEADKFFEVLFDSHDFDMAYCPFDYKDDLFWIGGLLDRGACGPGGRNFLGYLADGSNAQLDDNDLRMVLDEIRSHRDFKDKYRELTWKLHQKFLDRMPFVPLWQIDRHMIIHHGLDIYWDDPSEKVRPDRMDPASVFTGIEGWRLK